ncbi:MAG: M16 family metallopeptidase [Nitrospiraceae bacterium]
MSGRSCLFGRLALSAFLLIAWLAPASAPAQTTLNDPRTMQFEPVQFTPPEPERVVLENGLVVYLLEDHELPLVTITATLQTGAWLDPADTVGLAGLTGATMRTGGTAHMSAEEVDQELEQLAAGISVNIGTESGSAMLDVLKKDFPRGLRIFADILMAPAFDPGRVELAKLQAIEGIRRRQDQPQSIAGREFAKLLYGTGHPFARESSVASVTKITREDLLAFHAKTIHPNGIMLGVTGDFEKGPMLAALREAFGGWPKGAVPTITLPPIQAEQERGGKRIVRVVGKGSQQTHLRVGHLSIKESDPDYPAVSLLNDILGGSGFRSRLVEDVRTKQGLGYSVGSSLRAGVREQGLWGMRAETKLASTQEVVNRLVANMERLQKEPVTDRELAEAKEAFVNSFVFSFTSASSIVSRLIGLEYDGLPKDFLQQMRDKVVELTKDDVLQAARKHLHPEQLRILAVGPGDALPQVLSDFGEVQEIKLPPEG